MGEIATRERVESIQKCTADAAAEAVIDTLLALPDVLAARQSHRFALSKLLAANLRKVPTKTKTWVSGAFRPVLFGAYVKILEAADALIPHAL